MKNDELFSFSLLLKVLMKVTHSAATLLSSISMLFKLNFTQKLIFTFALQNSNIIQMKSLATEYLSQCLVDFIETIRLSKTFMQIFTQGKRS